MGDEDWMDDNQNSKHVKATPIKVGQYLRDQLSKGKKTDLLEDIPRHLEQQPERDENYTYVQSSYNRPNM